MAGIYIHIPFCKQACHYCDFHFSTSLKNKNSFVSTLLKEIELQKNYFDNQTIINTIYLGGGTPSLLLKDDLLLIFERLNTVFQIAPHPEITLEANPDDLTEDYLDELSQTPVNRLSIGVQSFFDEDLKWMNRAHTSGQALSSIKMAQEKGFDNITIDLIYGTPMLDDARWKENLQLAFNSGVKHISAYCLTIEPNTAFGVWQKNGKLKSMDEEKAAHHFEIMLEQMNKNEFIQYEISNFCKEDNYSKHNSNYWLGQNYLGLGPSAHSFNGKARRWNVSNNNQYIKALEENRLVYEEEILTDTQKYNEYILTSLRTIWGTDIDVVQNKFGKHIGEALLEMAAKYLVSGDIVRNENKLYLTDKGKLLADKISADVFMHSV